MYWENVRKHVEFMCFSLNYFSLFYIVPDSIFDVTYVNPKCKLCWRKCKKMWTWDETSKNVNSLWSTRRFDTFPAYRLYKTIQGMDFWERASSRMVKATIFSRILLRNYNLFLATAVVSGITRTAVARRRARMNVPNESPIEKRRKEGREKERMKQMNNDTTCPL